VSTATHEGDDFELVAGSEHGARMLGAGHDLAVALHGHAAIGQAELGSPLTVTSMAGAASASEVPSVVAAAACSGGLGNDGSDIVAVFTSGNHHRATSHLHAARIRPRKAVTTAT
jgi:hypothetical protein